MKNFTNLFLISVFFLGISAISANAQMMGGFSNSTADWEEVVEHTAREEKEGRELWEKLRAKAVACADFNDEQFGVLGEYFMGQMLGDSHAAMNAMMIQMMGEKGEEQMHIVMGKRLSGCDTSAAFPSQGIGFMPIIQMMMKGGSNSMMGNWGQNSAWWGGVGSWLISLLWLVWLIVGILAAIWLWKQIIKK